MLDTSARLLRLLSLLQVRREWTGAELARRTGVTGRTLRRDVCRLRELGYPVHSTPGVSGGYRLGAGSALPPLLLADDEALAVVVGLRMAAGGSVEGLTEASVQALAKLDQVLPARLRPMLAALQDATVQLPFAPVTVDADALIVLAGCCRDLHRLRFDYSDAGGAQSQRHVEPHRLVHTGRRWYLVARDLDRQEWRSFRVDRLREAVSTGRRFEPVDPPDAADFVTRAVSSSPYRFQARARIALPAAVLRSRIPAMTGLVEAAGADACVLTTGSDSLQSIAVHLAMLDADFTVLEPPELVEAVHALANRLLGAGVSPAVDARRRPTPPATPGSAR